MAMASIANCECLPGLVFSINHLHKVRMSRDTTMIIHESSSIIINHHEYIYIYMQYISEKIQICDYIYIYHESSQTHHKNPSLRLGATADAPSGGLALSHGGVFFRYGGRGMHRKPEENIQENHRKTIGKPQENPEKSIGKPWKTLGKVQETMEYYGKMVT